MKNRLQMADIRGEILYKNSIIDPLPPTLPCEAGWAVISYFLSVIGFKRRHNGSSL